jgi:hypothetical protein
MTFQQAHGLFNALPKKDKNWILRACLMNRLDLEGLLSTGDRPEFYGERENFIVAVETKSAAIKKLAPRRRKALEAIEKMEF